MPKSEKHSLPQCSSLFTFSLSLTPFFFPIQTIWVFSVFTVKPDILPKICSILRAAWRESSVPFSIIVVSSENCENSTSAKKKLHFGVPQESVLGPLLFTLYVSPIADITQQHNVGNMFYADDTQLYVSISPRDITSIPSLATLQLYLFICN